MRLEDAVKLSDYVRTLTNQLLDAITDLIEDEAVEAALAPAPSPVEDPVRLSTLGRYRRRVAQSEPVAVAIDVIVTSHGWGIGSGPGKDRSTARIMAVEALERAYRLDSAALDAALWVITSAWGYDRAGADGRIIEGLALLLHQREGLLRSQLAEHLRTQWTPTALLDVTKRQREEALMTVILPPRSCEIVARIVAESLAREGQ
jgi:hypothetical protein